ncbi:MAG: helix-turn-helix domain-containing protein [Minisyncoccia bacterium]|jgi:sugar-specific transcriptional regulator TrmB
MTYEQSLTQIGLTKDQAVVYEILVKFGPLQARYIQRRVALTRPLIYRALNGLIALDLVEKKDEPGKVSVFLPAHPLKLKEFIRKKKEEAEDADRSLNGILPKLSSDFNLISGKPGVRFFEGEDGVREIYDDILATGKNFHLIRSAGVGEFKEKMVSILKDFIKWRLRKGISVTALTPSNVQPDAEQDKAWRLTRTVVPVNDYSSPVEINIYGDKVAFISYKYEMVGFILESPQIAQAMREIFVLAQNGAAK